MKISVIIPVYNVEECYLYKCIESVISQTYHNIEIILINDGSTDNSGVICDEFAKKDNRIVVIHKENGGQSSARNFGINIAKGEYYSFVDADDYIDINMFKDLIYIARTEKADIIQCGFTKVDETSNTPYVNNHNNYIKRIKLTEALDQFYKNNLLSSIVCDKIFKKNIFYSLRFPLGQTMEDAYILSNIYAEISTDIIIVSNVYYYYLVRNGSTMNSLFSTNFMISSFKAYKNRMNVAQIENRKDLFILSSNQLASDLFQYYRLIYLKRTNGDKNEFYKIIKKWYNDNKQYISFGLIKYELSILYYFPLFIGIILKANKLRLWMQINK